MGSLFAVVMHMPLTSIIMIAELAQCAAAECVSVLSSPNVSRACGRSTDFALHELLPSLVTSVFVAMNIATRLPQ
eukprot:4374847-Amphidinium_carterae.1